MVAAGPGGVGVAIDDEPGGAGVGVDAPLTVAGGGVGLAIDGEPGGVGVGVGAVHAANAIAATATNCSAA